MKQPRLFLALDVSSEVEALRLVEETYDFIGALKVGPELFLKEGPYFIKKLSFIKPVFLDLKHFDIPNTVERTVHAAFDMGVRWLSVHAMNGRACMKKLKPLIDKFQSSRDFELLWITILTSFCPHQNPFPLETRGNLSSQVLNLASQLVDEGFSQFVCSAQEASLLRSKFPESFLLIPGTRFQDEALDDQLRSLTPEEALKNGASSLVIGRAIYRAKDPKKAAYRYYKVFQKK